ncbi:hypothetical protein MRB53_027221 [Persea americana]|uniref:Uncharacterized protein n=1 Tax=Persea americana TaxID=3435 RepID=A0ACC2LK93_PERAE|nr:hypothetical protein MRB53_027221 [Persea americana]
MMQRWCGKSRLSAAISAIENTFSRSTLTSRSFSTHLSKPLNDSISAPILKFLPITLHQPLDLGLGFRSPFSPFMMNQSRGFASKKKEKKRSPMTPVTSKLKKTKIKAYSSYKFRFRTMNDGKIRRWREGKRHNAHLKSKKAKRRLRKPEIVPAAYAKVMKKLNFCG